MSEDNDTEDADDKRQYVLIPKDCLSFPDHPEAQHIEHAILSLQDAMWHIDQCKNGATCVPIEAMWRNLIGSLRCATVMVDIGAQATASNFSEGGSDDDDTEEFDG